MAKFTLIQAYTKDLRKPPPGPRWFFYTAGLLLLPAPEMHLAGLHPKEGLVTSIGVQGESQLVEPTVELGEITGRVQAGLTRTARDIIEIGSDLLRAKELLGHGRFGSWIDAEFSLSHRSATNFMRAAERFAEQSEAVANLPPGVLLELASPSIPDGLVDAVLAGKVEPTVSAVRQQRERHHHRVTHRRAARSFAGSLWGLPDAPEAAAPVLAQALVDEAEAEGSDSFLPWAVDTLAAAVDLLCASGGDD